jgi:hypothetical protein
MTEPTPPADAPRPAPTFFDPSFERIPAAAQWDAPAGPVLLLFAPGAHREWVADAAIALATGWTRAGKRAVLADLSLDDPVLHDRIGMANLDGIVDIFLYGASLARSARPVPGRGFYLISGGTWTDAPGDILRHPRWEKIVAGFREAQASLLLFAPADADGLAALARWAGDAILLGGTGASPVFDRAPLDGVTVRAWLAPPAEAPLHPLPPSPPAPTFGAAHPPAPAAPPHAPPAPPPAERFPEPEPAATVQWSELPPPPPARRGDAPLPSAGETVGAPVADIPVPDPTWDRTEVTPAVRKRGARPLTLALLVVLLLVALGALAYTLRPDLFAFAGLGAAEEPAPAPAPARPSAPPVAVGTALPWTVSTQNFDNLGSALRHARASEREVPEADFYVVPEDVSGRMYYKVFAGIESDSAQAVALRERLVEQRVADPDQATGPSDLLQQRPLAYELGEYPSAAAAAGRADSLTARGIPAYPVVMPFTDGSQRWRVYGGAFYDSISAAPMGELLRTAGIPARLVPRVGRPPAAPK